MYAIRFPDASPNPMSVIVCVLAFSEPPESWGFRLSKAGTSWFIRIEADRVPRCLAALKREGIMAKALWPKDEMKNPPNSPSVFKGKRGERRPRGRAGREEYDRKQRRRETQQYVTWLSPKAEAIARALTIENAKRARLDRERSKSMRERKRQNAQRLAREQQSHVEDVLGSYLLAHPKGNA